MLSRTRGLRLEMMKSVIIFIIFEHHIRLFSLTGIDIRIHTYRHQRRERSPPPVGQPILSSWKVKACCHLVTLCNEKYTFDLLSYIHFHCLYRLIG